MYNIATFNRGSQAACGAPIWGFNVDGKSDDFIKKVLETDCQEIEPETVDKVWRTALNLRGSKIRGRRLKQRPV